MNDNNNNQNVWMDMHQRRVPLSAIIANYVEQTHTDIHALINKLSSELRMTDKERRMEMLRFFETKRLQLIRILIIVKWLQRTAGPSGILDNFKDVMLILENQNWRYQLAIDNLKVIAHNLETTQLPMWDIDSALHVMATGSYRRLPHIIESSIGLKPKMNDELVEKTMNRLNDKIRIMLLKVHVPSGFHRIRVERGFAILTMSDQMEAQVSVRMMAIPDGTKRSEMRQKQLLLAEQGKISEEELKQLHEEDAQRLSWQLFSLKCFLNTTNDSNTPILSEVQLLRLQASINERILSSDNALQLLYDYCRSVCARIQLHYLYVQAVANDQHGKLVCDYDGNRVLKVSYWRDAPRVPTERTMNNNSNNSSRNDFITNDEKMYNWLCIVDEGNECLRVSHHPPFQQDILSTYSIILNPHKLTIDPTNIDFVTLFSYINHIHVSYRIIQLYMFLQMNRQFESCTLNDTNTQIYIVLSECLHDGNTVIISIDETTGNFVLQWKKRLRSLTTNTMKLDDSLMNACKDIDKSIEKLPDNLCRIRLSLLHEYVCDAIHDACNLTATTTPLLQWNNNVVIEGVYVNIPTKGFRVNTFYLVFDVYFSEEHRPYTRVHIYITSGTRHVLSIIPFEEKQQHHHITIDSIRQIVRECTRKLKSLHFLHQIESLDDIELVNTNEATSSYALKHVNNSNVQLHYMYSSKHDTCSIDIIHKEFETMLREHDDYLKRSSSTPLLNDKSNVRLSSPLHNTVVNELRRKAHLLIIALDAACCIHRYNDKDDDDNKNNNDETLIPTGFYHVKHVDIGMLHVCYNDSLSSFIVFRWSNEEHKLSMTCKPYILPQQALLLREYEHIQHNTSIMWILERVYWCSQIIPVLHDFFTDTHENVRVNAQSSTRIRLQFGDAVASRFDIRMINPSNVIVEFISQQDRMPINTWIIKDVRRSLDQWYNTFGFLRLKPYFYDAERVAAHLHELYDKVLHRDDVASIQVENVRIHLPHVSSYVISQILKMIEMKVQLKQVEKLFAIIWKFTLETKEPEFKITKNNDLSTNECNVLEQYYTKYVGCSPFTIHTLHNFIRLLTFPSHVLKIIVSLISYQLNQQQDDDRHHIQMEITMCDAYPNAIDCDEQFVYFRIGFHQGNTDATFIPFRYSWQEHRLEIYRHIQSSTNARTWCTHTTTPNPCDIIDEMCKKISIEYILQQ